MRRFLARFVLVVGILAVVAGAAAWAGYAYFTGLGPLPEERTVILPRGAGVAAIAERLSDEGVVAHPWLFRLAAVAIGAERSLKAGEYAFAPGISLAALLRQLEEGRTVRRRLTVPEGLTVAQIFDLVRRAEGLSGELPEPPAEGRLLPETYQFSYGDDRAALIARMERAMDAALAELWPQRDDDLPFATPEEALTLASIVEKETGIPEERPRVAAVFVNRLRQGMRLDADPTVIYAVSDGSGSLGRPLTRQDLRTDSPFNTYRNAGLPPHPIANPGREAIRAVLQPAETDDLYFVADGSGGHVFAPSLDEHNRNVANWRRIQREAAEEAAAPE